MIQELVAFPIEINDEEIRLMERLVVEETIIFNERPLPGALVSLYAYRWVSIAVSKDCCTASITKRGYREFTCLNG